MPKGVEHTIPSSTLVFLMRVSSSVMPKGVEHTRPEASARRERSVSSSVMPKGVEHDNLGRVPSAADSVEFSDAERR